MNRFLFIMLLIPGMKGIAQMDTVRNKTYLDSQKASLFGDSTILNYQPRPHKQPVQNWLGQGTFLYNTSRGKIYVMPDDNIPCLVPDSAMVKPMPVLRSMPDTRMPNAYRRKAPANK